ncbi:MAG TPA: alkaline phosphatase family protein [Steroidobacteraceae bacterium]
MASATSVLLFPNKVFDLPQAGSNQVTRTLHLAQVGIFSINASGFVTRSDDLRPGGGPAGGGGSGPPGNHRTAVELDWSLISPDGKTTLKPSSVVAEVAITADLLARNRDAAGFSSGSWTLVLALPARSKVDSITQIDCSAMLQGMPVANQSPPPIVNVQQVLRGDQTHTFDFAVDRIGELTVVVSSTPPVPIACELHDFTDRIVASAVDTVTHPVTLADLHAARGRPWHLKLTAPHSIPGGSVKCTVFVRVVDTLRIPASVLQPRLDVIFGDPNTGGAFWIDINYDSRKKNVISITVSEDFYFTLDAFGYLDNLEDARLAFDRHSNPNAARVNLDPSVSYPFMSFDDGNEYHNFRITGMKATVGNPGSPGSNDPLVTLKIPIIPHGGKLEIHAGVGENVELEGLTITAEIYIGASEATGVTAAVLVPLLNGLVILDGLPPPVTDVAADLMNQPDLADLRTSVMRSIQDKLAGMLNAGMLQSVFTTLMGGKFTFLSSLWRDNVLEMRFIPPAEEPVHQVSPFYSARGVVPVGTAPKFTSPNLTKVDHIVVLLMENRSFDHVLGYLSLTGGRSDVDGLTPALLNSYAPGLRPAPYTETRLPFDPDHSFAGVSLQMGNGGVGNQPMRGFALSFLEKYPFMAFEPDSPQRKAQDDPYWYAARAKYGTGAIMGYHTPQTLPFYALLANQYMVCDRWYAAHPGPTFPNRFYYLSGHLGADASGEPQRDNGADSLRLLRSRTFQDALTERNISWKMYESGPDVCMLRMYARYAFDDTNIRPIEEFLAAAKTGTLPSVSFIEPNYHISKKTDDDHPPSDMAGGQNFVRTLYAALTANPTAWAKTLFILTYDEHGGLHDHHVPDLADRYLVPGKPPIDIGYGVRVPAFIISPWVPAGVTTRKIAPDAVFDHTSILKTIVNRFAPNDPIILSDRMAFANDLFPLLTLDQPRSATPVAMPPDAPTTIPTSEQMRAAARAMVAEARDQHAPLLRGRELFGSNVDWHQFMTRLALMLR